MAGSQGLHYSPKACAASIATLLTRCVSPPSNRVNAIWHQQRRADIAWLIQVHRVCVCAPHYHSFRYQSCHYRQSMHRSCTVIGAVVLCHGVKCADYARAGHQRMTVRYYLRGGVHEPVAPVSGPRTTVYALPMAPQPWLHKRSVWACNLLC